MMTTKERDALTAAGKTFLRKDWYPTPRIKIYKKGNWYTAEKFDTMEELEEVLKEYRENPHYIVEE
jgi:hypothetical protein